MHLTFIVGFCIGAGVSSWVTLLFIMITAGKIRKGSFREQESFNKNTLRIMEDRNDLDRRKVDLLSEMCSHLKK